MVGSWWWYDHGSIGGGMKLFRQNGFWAPKMEHRHGCRAGTGVDFTYGGATGPEKWGSLSPEYSVCANGKLQSPVNIVKKQAALKKNLKPLNRGYINANATLVNHGCSIGVQFDVPIGDVFVNGKNYTFKQMHWHTPSEHRIDGVQFPAELHLVHKTDDGSFAVVGIIYQYGKPDPLLSRITKGLGELAKEVGNTQAHIPIGIMDVRHMKRPTRKYFRYIGSLTTPPCTENVIWSVLGKVRSISKEQVAALKAPLELQFKNNSRPLQLLNDRKIELYNEIGNYNL